MFNRSVNYPTAIASDDDEGLSDAIAWCREHMQDGDKLTVWTSLKSSLRNNPQLERLAARPNVEHITGRGAGSIRSRGPVLMAWPNMDDIGELVRFGAIRIRALCIVSINDYELKPWVSAVKPTILGDGSAWDEPMPDLDPLSVSL